MRVSAVPARQSSPEFDRRHASFLQVTQESAPLEDLKKRVRDEPDSDDDDLRSPEAGDRGR